MRCAAAFCALFLGACAENAPSRAADAGALAGSLLRFPLEQVQDLPLPGNPTRFDYEDIDRTHQRLIIAHMDDSAVIAANLGDGSVSKVVPNIPVARGVAVADDLSRIFVTSSPHTLVILDSASLTELMRAGTGSSPDGVAWDPDDQIVGVSDQGDGAISLIRGGGTGARTAVPLGVETGNVVYDGGRGWFWAAVVTSTGPNQLAAIEPRTARVVKRVDLPDCEGAHGLRIHPDGASAFVACEVNNVIVRVDLARVSLVAAASTGAGPDVLSIDPGLGLLYVAAESGDLVVFDIARPGLIAVDRERPGDNAHSVAVDPATHRVFFPLESGPNGTPVLRIMRPGGS
jgi:DNA-binding beta-propeller fold protein YncE